MKKILLDTNFLIDVIRFRIDLSSLSDLVGDYVLYVPSPVVAELEIIAKLKSAESRPARVALGLLAKMKILLSDSPADKALIELADEKTLVATNDRALRKKLKSVGIKNIYLRSRKHLAIS